jgi:hypothetical protein
MMSVTRSHHEVYAIIVPENEEKSKGHRGSLPTAASRWGGTGAQPQTPGKGHLPLATLSKTTTKNRPRSRPWSR